MNVNVFDLKQSWRERSACGSGEQGAPGHLPLLIMRCFFYDAVVLFPLHGSLPVRASRARTPINAVTALKKPDFLLLRTAPRDHQPPTATPPRQPPTATNRQPPTANRQRLK